MSFNFNEVTELTKNFRSQYPSYAKGFVIDIGTINDLLTQNDGRISGIRLYMGIGSEREWKGVVVATVGSTYDDYGIPGAVSDPCNVILGEARPCPYQCGVDNALNQ